MVTWKLKLGCIVLLATIFALSDTTTTSLKKFATVKQVPVYRLVRDVKLGDIAQSSTTRPIRVKRSANRIKERLDTRSTQITQIGNISVEMQNPLLGLLAFPSLLAPVFEPAWSQNTSAILGQPARLKCRIRLLGDKMLSWIRQRDLHVLTSASVSYTSDSRFSVHHQSESDDWELKISAAQASDTGFYECQINTEPKINWPVFLQVYSGQAQISGPSEVHVRRGSVLSLICSLHGEFFPSDTTLNWYHSERLIKLETARNSLSLAIEKSEKYISSRLLLPRAASTDGGNYTCQPSRALSASVLVHVLNEEHPAAMQHGNRSGGSSKNPVQITSLLSLTFWTLDALLIRR